ncbi:MAG: hypothetical protein ACSLE0_03780 [Chitinophagaceae bacterium]
MKQANIDRQPFFANEMQKRAGELTMINLEIYDLNDFPLFIWLLKA